MATLTLTRTSAYSSSEGPGASRSKTFTLTGSSWTKLVETIANGTDTLVNVAVDVSAVKYFRVHSTTAATLQTNNGTTPDDTITLAADEYYEWNNQDSWAFDLGTDVTAIYVTNAA